MLNPFRQIWKCWVVETVCFPARNWCSKALPFLSGQMACLPQRFLNITLYLFKQMLRPSKPQMEDELLNPWKLFKGTRKEMEKKKAKDQGQREEKEQEFAIKRYKATHNEGSTRVWFKGLIFGGDSQSKFIILLSCWFDFMLLSSAGMNGVGRAWQFTQGSIGMAKCIHNWVGRDYRDTGAKKRPSSPLPRYVKCCFRGVREVQLHRMPR